ncbi:MAG: hypothetical protein ACRDZ6_02395 [Acidimicrobiales bacterium]
MLVAILLITVVVLPLTFILISTQHGASTYHLRAEAADLGTKALETAQYQTANGISPTSGVTTTTEYSGADKFTLAVDFELVTGTGAASSLCSVPTGTTSSHIWSVEATVSWRQGQVVERTLVSPSYADLADIDAGEIAVPVYNADDATLETATPIYISVQGSCESGSCGTIPSNEDLSESANTGSSGCAVFPNLYAGTGVSYAITASSSTSSNPGFVDPNELSDNATSPGVAVRTDVSVQANQVTILTNPFILAKGATATVQFQTTSFSGGSSSVAPAAYLPISVESSTLECSAIGQGTCVLGNGTSTGGFSSVSPYSTALLFPGPSTTPDYSAWAGDQADSSPGSGFYPSDVATSFTATSGVPLNLTLPVYPLSLTLTVKSDAGTLTSLTATDAPSGDTVTLNSPSGGTSATGMPLGQFELSAVTTGTSSTVSPAYVWVLPTGVCSSTTVMTQPCASPSVSSVAVTVG